jgi:hypothetical protein
MTDIRKLTEALRKRKKTLVYAALAIILLYTLIYETIFVLGPSYFGDDTVYTYYANTVLHGNFMENAQVFSFRLLNIYPIAFFYFLMGINNLSTAAWAITSLLGSIAVAFFIAKEIYNEYAGLLSALLLSFYPLFVVLSGTPTPNMPEAFVTGFTLLSLLLAVKRNSRLWYFSTGASAVASVLTTPDAAIVIFIVFAYLLIELVRKKFKINKVSAFLLCGLLAAGILLMLFNYINAKDPLITITGTAAVYSTAGTPTEGILINQDLWFYLNVTFPYKLVNSFSSFLSHSVFNPITIWQDIYVINYNYFGFFFYAFVIAAAYLIIRKEKSAYFPLLWFIVAFAYLEFGPIYFSLIPFRYILTHRLERYLTIVSIPAAIIISIAIVRMVKKSKGNRKIVASVLAALFVIFLIASSIPINLFWYQMVTYETYDQIAISNYLNKLPDTTSIYFESGFSNMQVYTHYDNLSRFHDYTGIKNCSDIPAGSYVVVPKFLKVFNISYTPNPLVECPDWILKLYPRDPGNFSGAITGPAVPFAAQLFYVPNSNS